MNDSSQGEPTEPLAEAPGANGAATEDSAVAPESEEQAALEALQREVAALRREATGAKDLARRAQADLANVRRRVRNERAEFRSRAVEEISSALLPVLDDLHRAASEVEKTTQRFTDDRGGDPAETLIRGLHEGLRLVLRRFQDALRRQGVLEIEARGSLFDPRFHDAVQEVPREPGQRDGEVVEVLRRGYLLDDRVIRPVTVVVAAGSAASDEAPETGDGSDESGGDPAAGPATTGPENEPLSA